MTPQPDTRPADDQAAGVYEIGPFRLDAGAGVVTRDGVPIALGHRAGAVLSLLVRWAPEFVPKARLLDGAWPGVVVEENNLMVQISAIRRALAEAPGGEQWIETLSRRGYRFVGPLSRVAGRTPGDAVDEEPRSKLPEPLTSFVGRVRELTELRTLLAQHRLVTLTGPGGVGKTRLALEAATRTRDNFPDGTWFVDLAPVGNPTFVPKAIAQALGLRDAGADSVAETLRSHLRRRRTLLILDNCEHLVEGCAGLVDSLLRAAPKVCFLVTSREALRVEGEQCYQLGPLSLPTDPGRFEALARSEAVQLFVERARLQRSDFALTEQHAPAIAELCVRLDGMPLALELAAARISVLPVAKIVDRLNDRFRLLSASSRTSLPRQQTLHATIAWSFDLLSESARTLFARLAVFTGSFSLEAAEGVAPGASLPHDDVLDLLSSLVDKSLVLVDSRGTRYRLLETIREFARERLQSTGDVAAVRDRHLAWYLRLAEGAEPSLQGGPQQKQALDLLDADHDNLRAALAWSVETPERNDRALRLCGALYRFWSRRGYWREGYTECMRALAQPPRPADGAARAKVLLTAGSLGNNVPEAETRTLLEQALALAREVGDRDIEAMALNNLARVLDWDVELPRARSLLEEAQRINRELANRTRELHNMSNLVNVLRRQPDPEAALAFAEEGLVAARAAGDRWLEGIFLYLLGRVALDRDDIGIAQAFNERSLAIARELAMPDWQSFALVKLAYIAVVRNDCASAHRHLAEAIAICRRFGSRLNLSECFGAMGVLASKEGLHAQAARMWGVSTALLGSLRSSDVLERESVDTYCAMSREALGNAAYEARLDEGRALPREEAMDEAVTWLASMR